MAPSSCTRAADPTPLRRPARATAALVFGVAIACGDPERPAAPGTGQPIPGCEGFSYRACDILNPDCQREVFGLVACVRGDTDVSGPPPVRALDEATATELLETSAESGAAMDLDAMNAAMDDPAPDQRAFAAEVRGLELLGLLAPDLIEEPDDVVEQTISNVIAYYLVPTREVVIIDRGAPVDDLNANMVLAHEFVHALQDGRHDLTTFGADLEQDSDGSLARSSLIEGEASLYQDLLMFAYQGADLERIRYASFFASLTDLGLDLTRDAGSPALTATGIFPYTYGTVYAGQAWLSGGSAGLDALYQAPPRTSRDVLGGDVVAAQGVNAFATPPPSLDGYTEQAEDTVGAWVSVAMLAGLASGSDATRELPDLARHWRGDRYWVYATSDESPAVAVAWAIDWTDEEAANRFSSLASALAPEGAALRIDTSGASTRLVAVERPDDLEAWRARLAELSP